MIGNSTYPVYITARGKAAPVGAADVAIGSLTVGGRVERSQILAGISPSSASVNADAQIGAVTVGGNWIASNLVAGAKAGADGRFGTPDDVRMSGANVKDDAALTSKIGPVKIGGQVRGTTVVGDHFGIVAQQIVSLQVGGTPLTLLVGAGNDDLPLGLTSDFRVHEVL